MKFERLKRVFILILMLFVVKSILACQPIAIYINDENNLSLQERYFHSNNSYDKELICYGRACLDILCSKPFKGRKAGTNGWDKAFAFLLSEIKEMGYVPDIQPFVTEQGTEIKNIIVTIPGVIDSTIIVGAHFDGAVQSTESNHYPAANDNGSGTVTQLILLKDLAVNPLTTDRTVKVIFWGSEEVFEGQAFRGSLFYTQSLSENAKSFLLTYINVDTIGHQREENVVSLNHSGEKRVEAAAMRTAAKGCFNYAVSKRVTNLVSDYAPFFGIKIPYLNYHDHCGDDCANKLHTANDIPEAVSIERLYKVSQDIRGNIETY